MDNKHIDDDLLKFWGKTNRDCSQTSPQANFCKPVLHHLLDVAAVTWQLLSDQEALCQRISRATNLPPTQTVQLLSLCAGLHDLGKYSVPFQAKSERFWPVSLLGAFVDCPQIHDMGHWRYTATLLWQDRMQTRLEKLFPDLNSPYGIEMAQLVAAISGHHGQPPELNRSAGDLQILQSDMQALTETCVDMAGRAFDCLARLIVSEPFTGFDLKALNRSHFLINGLITLCDWTGSDTAYFPVEGPGAEHRWPNHKIYWENACRRANQALTGKGIVGPGINSRPTFSSLGLLGEHKPRPLQQLAESIELDEGPQLFVIEDTTGSGKTEAALMLAARLMAAGKGEGFYFALPTMATANAMQTRLECVYRFFFAREGTDPSIVLAHSKSRLADELKAKQFSEGEETAAGYCNDWISSSRRLALLADVGIGTIDQAFIAVLRKKFLTLRHAALARRILIIDEAHSFDAYMGKELETLVQLHAMHGGSVVVLSATLSQTVRRQLIAAFQGGLPEKSNPDADPLMRMKRKTNRAEPVSRHFPLLTSVSAERLREEEVTFDTKLEREVKLERLSDRREAIELALKKAAKGAAVAVVCNAVDEAIGVYQEICNQMEEPDRAMLFHARFAVGDRLDIERRVLEIFGKNTENQDRAGRILVATQVIEQSLDLDFDFMISDLAPIDMLVQRAGRLWRHMQERPAGTRPLARPTMAIISADPQHVDTENWLEPVLGKAAFVYRNPAIMWKSASVVCEKGVIRVPDDLRYLIEAVYGESKLEIPACLEPRTNQAIGDELGSQSMAMHNTIDLQDGYMMLGELSANEDIGTRLGEKTITIRLAHLLRGKVTPWYSFEGGDDQIDWELSEVVIREKLWCANACEAQTAETKKVKEQWPEFERDMPILIVGEVGDADIISNVTYSKSTGIEFTG